MSDKRPDAQLYRRSRAGRNRAPAPVAAKPAAASPAAPADDTAPGVLRAVNSLTNPVVKDMRALQLKKERQRTGLFLAEGLKLITDAIERDWPIQTLAYAGRVREQPMVKKTVAAALAKGALVIEVTDEVLEKISRRDNPQMVVAVFEQRLVRLEALDPAAQTVIVALEAIKDPGNLGTIIRTADSVGASAVVLVGETTDPFAIEAVRATMGSIFNLPIAAAGIEEFCAWARAHKVPVVGTHLAGAVDYRQPAYAEPMVLLMGNEQSGLPPALVAACDTVVKIPMAGRADSLNLAVATGVMLYELRRNRIGL